MKLPGPDHPITIANSARRTRVLAAGHVIADTDEAVVLTEASRPPVKYFPREDVETGFLARSATVTHCPYKGDAAHYTLHIDGELIEDAAWSYENPYPAMERIRGLLAFYPKKVEVYEIDDDRPRHDEGTGPTQAKS